MINKEKLRTYNFVLYFVRSYRFNKCIQFIDMLKGYSFIAGDTKLLCLYLQ